MICSEWRNCYFPKYGKVIKKNSLLKNHWIRSLNDLFSRNASSEVTCLKAFNSSWNASIPMYESFPMWSHDILLGQYWCIIDRYRLFIAIQGSQEASEHVDHESLLWLDWLLCRFWLHDVIGEKERC